MNQEKFTFLKKNKILIFTSESSFKKTYTDYKKKNLLSLKIIVLTKLMIFIEEMIGE